MASYIVADSEVGVRSKALVAATVDTVTFDRNVGKVEILVATADASGNDIWYTTDGSTPAVNGAASFRLVGLRGAAVTVDTPGGDVVKLISTGTPSYDVSAIS